MSLVRGKNSKAEIRVRSLLHRRGYRFILHCPELPGKPDIVLPKHRVAIFVHGCFWHQHPGCPKASVPKTNANSWASKLARNMERDEENRQALREAGWRVSTIWECELKDLKAVVSILAEVLPTIEERPAVESSALETDSSCS